MMVGRDRSGGRNGEMLAKVYKLPVVRGTDWVSKVHDEW